MENVMIEGALTKVRGKSLMVPQKTQTLYLFGK